MYNNDVGGGTISSVLSMTAEHDGAGSNSNIALMVGPEHTAPTVLTLMPSRTNVDNIGGRIFASDGVHIGAAVSPDNLFEYSYRTNNRATEYGSLVSYGGARGDIRWNKDTVAGTDYKAFIIRYDTDSTLFYLDPPYYLCESDYGRELFNREEFPLMAELLKGIKGTFILSLNDHTAVRDIFKDFYIKEVETTYSIAVKTSASKVGELIISNHKL